jgi:hypothetical protein
MDAILGPSSRWYASSPRIQYHRVHVRDSGAVVTPFVQVTTYATRTIRVTAAVGLQTNFLGKFLRIPIIPNIYERNIRTKEALIFKAEKKEHAIKCTSTEIPLLPPGGGSKEALYSHIQKHKQLRIFQITPYKIHTNNE